jgi:hypothetical protein
MAQPGMKPIGGILPNETVVIHSNGTPDPQDFGVKNGDVIAFQTKPEETKQWLVQFFDLENENVPYPMTFFVPEKGGKSYVVVDWDTPDTTVYYSIEPFPDTSASAAAVTATEEAAGLAPQGGKYSITIGSTGG